jgi:GT2 family glycosyltransferase
MLFKTTIVFLVVVYRNTNDLIPFFNSLNASILIPYKVIIIENFYNDEVHKKIENLQLFYNFDLIVTDNKGYGHGNNLGIKYAMRKYEFDYLIVSNPDIIISKFGDLNKHFLTSPNSIIGPIINTKKRKNQNPFIPFRFKFLINSYYDSFISNNKITYLYKILLNKLFRISFLLFMFFAKKTNLNSYSVHGSFIVFPKSFLIKNPEVFNPKMFLYFEELNLSELARKHNYKIFVSSEIKIIHFEDGSTSDKKNTFTIQKESFKIFYDTWFNKNS